jgi:hypothetical protein
LRERENPRFKEQEKKEEEEKREMMIIHGQPIDQCLTLSK